MSTPDNPLQAAIYTRLTTYAGVTALVGTRTYDHVPETAASPYIVIGDDTIIDWSSKSRNGWEATVTIHCWDFEKAGRKSVKAIMSAIYDALHRQESSITVTGFSLVTLQFEFGETFQETAVEGQADRYYHGVQRFRAVITP